jgi:LemA protein
VKHNVQRAWADVSVLLHQRQAEVPKLVAVCSEYAGFEASVLARLTQARAELARALENGDLRRLSPAERKLHESLARVFATAEDYPQLRAQERFAHLAQRISALETAIADRREFYNRTAQINNETVRSFPAVLLAAPFGFGPVAFLLFDPAETRDVDLGRSFEAS